MRLLNQPKLPNQFKVRFENFHKFKWKDRWRIFIGYNLLTHTDIMIDKRDGRVKHSQELMLTSSANEEEVRRSHAKKEYEEASIKAGILAELESAPPTV